MIGVYKITNTINNKVYIGQSVEIETRWKAHIRALNRGDHTNEHLQAAWNKYTAACFNFEILCECDINDIDELEQKYIAQYKSCDDRYGYNYQTGGHNNHQLAESTKKKLSIALSGHKMSEENRKEVIKRMRKQKGKRVICINTLEIFDTITDACHAMNLDVKSYSGKISLCCKGKQLHAGKHYQTGEPLGWMYYNDEDVNDIIKKYNKRISDSYQLRCDSHSEILKGYTHTQNAKLNMKKSKREHSGRKVRCITTDIIFQSIAEAAEFYNISACGIHNCCAGKSKSSGRNIINNQPLIWEYYPDAI